MVQVVMLMVVTGSDRMVVGGSVGADDGGGDGEAMMGVEVIVMVMEVVLMEIMLPCSMDLNRTCIDAAVDLRSGQRGGHSDLLSTEHLVGGILSITITCTFGGDSSLRDSASQTDVLWQIYTVLPVVEFGGFCLLEFFCSFCL